MKKLLLFWVVSYILISCSGYKKDREGNYINLKGESVFQRNDLKVLLLGKTPNEVKEILGTPVQSDDALDQKHAAFFYVHRSFQENPDKADQQIRVYFTRFNRMDTYGVKDVTFK